MTRKSLSARKADERGVAMVTVILVGAVLTIVATTAAFMTIAEIRASTADRSGAQAFTFAEAGIDRFVYELRRGTFTWQQLNSAGCDGNPYLALPPGSIGDGTYVVELAVYDPTAESEADRLPPAACANRPPPGEPAHFALLSLGRNALAGQRLIRQVVRVQMMPLPVGIFVQSVDANGQTQIRNASLIATGDVWGRDRIGFSGTDVYYTMQDFYGSGASATTNIPAAAHASGAIYAARRLEHPPNPNCNANPLGTAGQSLWDGSAQGGPVTSGCTGQAGFPPTAYFAGLPNARNLTEEEYQMLREAAKTSGIYCNYGARSCTSGGAPMVVSTTITAKDVSGLPASFVAYFDFASGTNPDANVITWKAAVGPCSDSPSVNRSVVVVIRNGGLKMNGAPALITGAAFLPEGIFDSAGSYNVHGPLIAREMRLRGSGLIEMSECWLKNIPSPLLDVRSGRWSELDR